MSEGTTRKKPTIGFQLSSVISVSLLLFLIGLITATGIVANDAGSNMRGQIGFVVKLYKGASDADVEEVRRSLVAMPGVSNVEYTSADAVLAEERTYNPDMLDLVVFNPYSDEFEVFVKNNYANNDSISNIITKIDMMSLVEDVYMQPDLADNINEFIHRVEIYLVIFALVLLVISFSLIFNTMRMSVFSRRFIVYNMKLIGATNGYIQKPYIVAGALTGIVSAVLGFVLLMLFDWYTSTLYYDLLFSVSTLQYAFVFAVMLLSGVIVCVLASYLAVRGTLHTSYDDLFG